MCASLVRTHVHLFKKKLRTPYPPLTLFLSFFLNLSGNSLTFALEIREQK